MKLCALQLLALIAVATLAAPAGADGTDTSDLQRLLGEPVVSTASKTAEADAVAPATTTIVTGDDLQRFGMHTVGEALNFLSLGVIGDSPQGLDADEFGARGVLITGDLGSHFLLLINGHTVNQPLGGSGEFASPHATGTPFGVGLGLPLEMVDHIEVTLGPGSVLYGSNAMLGIVNVVTRRASAFHGVHLAAESQLLTTARGFAGVGYEFSVFGTPGEVTAGVEYFGRRGPGITIPVEQTGIGPWGGTAGNNNVDVPSGVLRIVTGNFELNARAHLKDASLPLAGLFDDSRAHDLERRLSLELSHHAPLSSLVDVTSRIYFDTYDLQGRYYLFTTTGIPVTATAYWGGAEVRGSLDWFNSGRFVTLVGAEATYRQVAQLALVTLSERPTSVAGHLDRHDLPLAAYAQQTWQPKRWLAFNAGLRLDRDERFPAQASPRIAASVKPWEGGTFKAIYSTAFRAPTLAESYGSFGVLIPPTHLVPETVRSLEASVEHDFGTQRIFFGVYWSTWENLTYLHAFTPAELAAGTAAAGAVQEQNSALLTNPGFNAGYEGQLSEGRWRYGVTFTGAVAHRAAGGNLPASPNTFGNAHLAYDLRGGWPELALAAYYMGPRRAPLPVSAYLDPDTLPIVPAQVVLRPTISGPVPAVAGLSYRVSVNWSFASKDPYLVGPNARVDPSPSQLVPVEKLRATVGLAYQF